MKQQSGSPSSNPRLTKWRNIIGFWILGINISYPYNLMLSAAFDIIHQLEESEFEEDSFNATNPCTPIFNDTTNITIYPPREPCQHMGTSVILLADTLPMFIMVMAAPYFSHFFPYWIRVFSIAGLCLASFLIVAFSSSEAVILLGVVCASLCTGLAEVTLISFSTCYHKSTMSALFSGMGAAGIAATVLYAVLRSFLTPKVILLIQVFIPAITIMAYVFIITRIPASKSTDPPSSRERRQSYVSYREESPLQHDEQDETTALLSQDYIIISPYTSYGIQDNNGSHYNRRNSCTSHDNQDHGEDEESSLDPLLDQNKSCLLQWFSSIKFFKKDEAKHWWSHVKYVPHLFKYMVPLFLVYFAAYGINQTFFELLYAPNTHIGSYCLDQHAQYSWLLVMYTIGTFISVSSLSIVYIKYYWILSVLQVINFVFFFLASIYGFLLPSFWLTCFLGLCDGLFAGGVYVNAFYTVNKKVPKVHREFSVGVVSLAHNVGICVAAVSSIFIHKFICGHFIGYIHRQMQL